MILIDSNLIIYAVQAQFKDLREWILETAPCYSIISRVEVLGFAKLQPIEKKALTEILDNLELVYLNRNYYEIAIALKQQRCVVRRCANCCNLLGISTNISHSEY